MVRCIITHDNGFVHTITYPARNYLGGYYIDNVDDPIFEEVNGVNKIIGYSKKELTINDCKLPPYCNGLESFIYEGDVPEVEYINQIKVLNGAIAVDEQKVESLMPAQLIKAKHMKFIANEIDLELGQENPDAVKIVRLQREFEKCKLIGADSDEDQKFWYQKALEGLDRAEIDKPIIRQKILDKIAS